MTSDPPESVAEADPAARLRASERVADVLSDRIRSGLYGAGDLLPTERVLAADLGVHRRSVRTAIDQLVRSGLVSRRPNCRPTVRRASPEAPAAKAGHDGSRAAPRITTSNLIALIMWHGGGPLEHAGTAQQRIFRGMNQALVKFGHHAVFLDVSEQVSPEGEHLGSPEEIAAQEAAHLRYIQEQGFGGALFYPYAYRRNRDLAREVSRSVPLVLLDRRMAGVDGDFVGVDNVRAMREVTQHLIAQGHRRIACLTNSEPIHPVQDRVQGYIEAMRGADSADMTEMVLTVPPHGESDDRTWRVVDAVFRLPQEQRPTAAVCFTDYMAVGLAQRLESLGLSVPGDVALTGFDNIVPVVPNGTSLPFGTGLTTMAQPFEEIGSRAVELLMRRLRDRQAPPASVELPARLIVRASSSV